MLNWLSQNLVNIGLVLLILLLVALIVRGMIRGKKNGAVCSGCSGGCGGCTCGCSGCGLPKQTEH